MSQNERSEDLKLLIKLPIESELWRTKTYDDSSGLSVLKTATVTNTGRKLNTVTIHYIHPRF